MNYRLLVPVLLAFLAACDGDSNPSSPTPTPAPPQASQANISVSVTPGLVIVEQASTGGFCTPFIRFIARFNVVVTESAGLGGNINFVNVAWADGSATLLNYGADQVVSAAGTNHVNARSSLTVPLGMEFCILRSRSVRVTVDFTDDRGNRMSSSALFSTALKE